MSNPIQTSTGKLMLLIVLTAVELALFQDVWSIVVIPPVTAMTLGLNLGLWFVLLRPRWMEPRIIGMLVGSLAALAGISFYLWWGWTEVRTARRIDWMGPIGAWVATTAAAWSSSVPDQRGNLAAFFDFISRSATWIEFAVLDLCCLAVIWTAGSLDCRLRRRRHIGLVATTAVAPPIDDCAATRL